MEVFKVNNPEVVKLMNISGDSELSSDEAKARLVMDMIANPDNVCVVVIVDGEKIVGHTVGLLPADRNIIWSLHSWVDKDVDSKYSHEGSEIVKNWAINSFDIHEIKCETQRSARAMQKAYGFEEESIIMSCKF